jgi:hypothetical protein
MATAPRPAWSAEVRGFLRFLRILLVIALLAIADLGVWLIFPPATAGLPPGATRLELPTLPSRFGSRLVLGCPAAAFPDLRVERANSTMVFIRVGGAGGAETSTGADGRIDPVWPAGWSARIVEGRAELVDPEGGVVAREGDVIRSLGGGNGMVCLTIGARLTVEPAATSGSVTGPMYLLTMHHDLI